MSHPYRSFSELEIVPNRSFLGRIRSTYRKFLLWRYGKASIRFQWKCSCCRKLFSRIAPNGIIWNPSDYVENACPKCYYEIQQEDAIKNNMRLIPPPPTNQSR